MKLGLRVSAWMMLSLLAQTIQAATVTVTVHDVKGNVGGTLYATLYCGEPNWLDPAKAAGHAQAVVTGESTMLKFENVAPGGCATNIYHDENGNGKLDMLRGPFPIPTEGVAVSNNAIRRGPPRYKQAEFQVTEPGVSLDVKMSY